MLRWAAPVGLAALVLCAVPATAGTPIRVTAKPRKGAARTRFVVSFVATDPADGQTSYYGVRLRGPRRAGCASRADVQVRRPFTAGQRVIARVRPPRRRVWCRGRFAGIAYAFDRNCVASPATGEEQCSDPVETRLGSFRVRTALRRCGALRVYGLRCRAARAVARRWRRGGRAPGYRCRSPRGVVACTRRGREVRFAR